MRMKQAALFLLMAVLMSVMLVPENTSAYTGGLLNGKNITVGNAAGTVVVGQTALVTDNDEATFYSLSYATSGQNNTHMWYTFPAGVTLTSYQVKAEPNTNFRLYLTNWSDSVETINFTATGSPIALNRTNIKRVTLIHTNATSSNVYEFDVFGTMEGVPSAPTGLIATAGVESASLSWNVHSSSNVIGYNVYMGGVKQNGALVTTTSYSKTGLVNGTPYSFQVTAVDRFGQESDLSVSRTVTPLAAPDTTPPAAPTSLTGSGGNAIANLSWSAVTAPDFAGYHVYRDGVQLTAALITATSYQATGLENDRAYEFYVKAFDTSGNGSTPSNTVTVTPSDNMTVSLIPNGTSIIVRITGGSIPFTVTGSVYGEPQTFTQREFALTGLTKDTDYTVNIEDNAGKTYSQMINTGSTTSFIPPVMPDSTSLFQKMLNSFGTAGTIAIAVIGGAVALGILIIIGLWGWRLLKKWLASSK